MYPSGLFFSSDTGLEWSSAEGDKRQGWRCALYDPIERFGIGATTLGRLQVVDGTESRLLPLSLGTSRVTDVTYDASAGRAWLVGERGLALSSVDFGANWSTPSGGLPRDAQNYFDFNAVFARDDRVALVGSPGSMFF